MNSHSTIDTKRIEAGAAYDLESDTTIARAKAAAVSTSRSREPLTPLMLTKQPKPTPTLAPLPLPAGVDAVNGSTANARGANGVSVDEVGFRVPASPSKGRC